MPKFLTLKLRQALDDLCLRLVLIEFTSASDINYLNNEESPEDVCMYPINVVEKETSISKYLLRMWERRYSFPRPSRDAKGERLYTNDDVEKLKLVKRLMEEGYRPSKIIDQTLDDLRALSKSYNDRNPKVSSEAGVILLLTSPHLEQELRRALKNHKVRDVFTISNQEDINNLTL